jgi:hypothetical protein
MHRRSKGIADSSIDRRDIPGPTVRQNWFDKIRWDSLTSLTNRTFRSQAPQKENAMQPSQIPETVFSTRLVSVLTRLSPTSYPPPRPRQVR